MNIRSRQSRTLLNSIRSLLSDDYGYPKEWFPSRWRCKETAFGIQISVCTNDGAPILIGIVSARAFPNSVNHLKQTLERETLCSLGIVVQGNALSAYRYRSKNSDLVSLGQLEPYKPCNIPTRPTVYAHSTSTTTRRTCELTPLTTAVETLFFEAHSHIRDIDGLHSDEALDELCKLLYVKLFDEEHTPHSQPFRAQYGIYGNTAELSTCLRELYNRANEHDTHVHASRIPGYKASRGVFDDPIKLSAPALAKVVAEFQRYDISHSDLDVKGRAFQRVFTPALRAGMGQYFTPHNVVRFIVDSLCPHHTEVLLDPFCGSGHFFSEALDYVRANNDDKVADEFAYQNLHGIEKSERMVRIAMTDMRLHGDGFANIRCTDALLPFTNYHDLDRESFDLVLTNPPFGSVLGVDALSALADFELARKRRKIPLELLGLERALEFLRPAGMLAIVLPESIFVNSSAAYVRQWITTKAQVRAVISLPIETFTPFGANIKTSILFCQKHAGRQTPPPQPVFCGVIEDIGHDSAGRVFATADYLELSAELRQSLASRKR